MAARCPVVVDCSHVLSPLHQIHPRHPLLHQLVTWVPPTAAAAAVADGTCQTLGRSSALPALHTSAQKHTPAASHSIQANYSY